MKSIKRLLSVILALGIMMGSVPVLAAPTLGTVSKELQTLGTTTIIHAVSTIQDGQPVAVCLVGGSTYGVLHVIDINKEKIIKSIIVEDGGRPTYGMADSKGRVHLMDGNKVRIYDPKDKTLYTTTGIPTTWSGSSNGLIELDGKFYGATTSYGRIFFYEVGGGCTVVADLRTHTDINALTGLAGVNGYIYTGGKYVPEDGEGTYFYKVNPTNGAVTKISNPENKAVRNYGYITDIGKYVFAQATFMDGEGGGYIYDTETGTWLDKTLDVSPNVISQEFNGKKYYLDSATKQMTSIDVETLETVSLGYSGGNYYRASGLPFKCDYFGDEVCFLQSQFNGNLFVYTTTLGKTKRIDVDLIPADEPHRISRTGFDGDVYVTAFQGSNGADYDPDTKTFTTYSMGQGEGIVARGSKVYIGSYPGATIHELDTSKPYNSGNPKTIYDISGNQDRPFGMDLMDNYLLVGTLPASGTYNGAFTVIDLYDYSAVEYTTDTLGVAGHSILTVTHDDRYAYLGTSVTSGSGTIPANGGACVIKFDMQTREVTKKYELSSFAGYTNVKGVHGLRISPYDGLLYGTCAGIDFVMDPADLSVKKTNVYDASAVLTSASTTSQIWHEHYMQFYGGYLFRKTQVIDPATMKVVATAGTDAQFAGIYDDTAYYVSGNCTVYSMPITFADDATSTVTDFTWDSFEPGEGTYRIVGDAPVIPSIGQTLSREDVSLKIYAGAGEGKNPDQALNSTAPGMVFQMPKSIKDCSFVVGMDFYVPNENIEATLLAPVGSEDGAYQVPVFLEKGGNIYVLGKYNRRYDIGKVEIGKWNKIALKYNNSTTGYSSVTVYLNGEHKEAWDTFEKKYYSGVHGYNFHKQPMKEFEVKVAARTTDLEYANDKTYYGRNEYLEIDNVFITSDTSVVDYGTILLNTELVDNKTVKLTFNKPYSATLTGTSVLDESGASQATVQSQSASGNTLTLTFNKTLSPNKVYSIKLSDISGTASFKTELLDYANFEGTGADNIANGDTIIYTVERARSIDNGAIRMWSKYGGGDVYANEVADHVHGEEVSFGLPNPISNTEAVFQFDYYRAFDTVTRISPRFEGQLRYRFGPCLDIDKNGNLSITSVSEGTGTAYIGNVGSYEWHKIGLKYDLSTTNGVIVTVYLDGVNKGTYTNTAIEYTKPLVSFSVYNTAYTSEEGKAISTTRPDARPEYCMIDNMLLTSDLSVVDYGAYIQKAELTSFNTILFTCNKEIEVPIIDDVFIEGLTPNSVKLVGKNAFEVTVDEKITINSEYQYDIYIGDDNPMGTFLAKMPEMVETFDAGDQGFAVNAGYSHQRTSRDGKIGYSNDKSFGWSPLQRNAVGSGYENISKDSGNILWLETNNFLNEKLVISADFMRGSERVGFWPFALVRGAYRDPIATIEITPSGEFKVAGTTYATGIKPLEWHNLTLQLYILPGLTFIDAYFDGKLVVDNCKISSPDGFHTIKTIGEFETLTDSSLTSLNNVDPKRNDIVIIDNMYIGRDLKYTTSDIVLEWDNTGVSAYTGAVSRDNIAIKSHYDEDGAIKDVQINSFKADKLTEITIEDATKVDNVKSGDVVKFFIIDNFKNLRPLSNVLIKEHI